MPPRHVASTSFTQASQVLRAIKTGIWLVQVSRWCFRCGLCACWDKLSPLAGLFNPVDLGFSLSQVLTGDAASGSFARRVAALELAVPGWEGPEAFGEAEGREGENLRKTWLFHSEGPSCYQQKLQENLKGNTLQV
jgi:hypothetical protein